MEKIGASIIQIGPMRITIAKPPFSDGLEITAVRPVAKVSFDSYRHSNMLKERLKVGQRGYPHCRSTELGQVHLCRRRGRVSLKLQLSGQDPRIASRSADPSGDYPVRAARSSIEASADILLLVRPDYTIYDEVRKTRDFHVFADMRLAGVV